MLSNLNAKASCCLICVGARVGYSLFYLCNARFHHFHPVVQLTLKASNFLATPFHVVLQTSPQLLDGSVDRLRVECARAYLFLK